MTNKKDDMHVLIKSGGDACHELIIETVTDLIKNRSDKDIPKKPLVINGMGGGVLRVVKPEGSGHRGALLVSLVEGGVEVGQQLVPHLDGTPPCICHGLPQIQLLQRGVQVVHSKA